MKEDGNVLTNESIYCQLNLQEMETSERRYRERSLLIANYPKYSIEHSSNMVHDHRYHFKWEQLPWLKLNIQTRHV